MIQIILQHSYGSSGHVLKKSLIAHKTSLVRETTLSLLTISLDLEMGFCTIKIIHLTYQCGLEIIPLNNYSN